MSAGQLPKSEPLAEELPSRFVVGIDLGTTNCAVSYVDTAERPWQVRDFCVPQLVAQGQIEALETLPSFHFEPPAGQLDKRALRGEKPRAPHRIRQIVALSFGRRSFSRDSAVAGSD